MDLSRVIYHGPLDKASYVKWSMTMLDDETTDINMLKVSPTPGHDYAVDIYPLDKKEIFTLENIQIPSHSIMVDRDKKNALVQFSCARQVYRFLNSISDND